MCIIIYRPADAAGIVTREELQSAAAQNRDGYGLMWRGDDGKVRVWRGDASRRKDWIGRFMALQKFGVEIAAHARYATHGVLGKTMCHPFWIVPGKSALMHNGVLSPPEHDGQKGWSDTKFFVENIVKRLPEDWSDHVHLRWLVEQATSGNKLVIFERDRCTIINEKLGHWREGIWFSNHGYVVSKPLDKPYTWMRGTKDWGTKDWFSDDTEKKTSPLLSLAPVTSERREQLYRFEGVDICSACFTSDISQRGPEAEECRPSYNPNSRCWICSVQNSRSVLAHQEGR